MPLSRRARRFAIFWAVLAFVVWNAVFDRVIVVSGRRYIRAAEAADASGAYLSIDEAMRPAVVRAFWMATAAGAAIAAVGVFVVRRLNKPSAIS